MRCDMYKLFQAKCNLIGKWDVKVIFLQTVDCRALRTKEDDFLFE